ncbi:hypothetical protein HK100_011166 [Physocladia obscura]|uniref:BZIP domain-containing protein n=1 Tax=Physocladia obscura TaxID=109957 RepID=A0AAD5XM71_9FUNG|nr:hypothetical protein HK100_011166 [Physocladia obscura]
MDLENVTYKQEKCEPQEQKEQADGRKKNEGKEGTGSRKGRIPPASPAKRTLQIRNAQKAYRERKEARMLQLETQVAELTSRLEAKANNNMNNINNGSIKRETTYLSLTPPASSSSCTDCPSCCKLLQLLHAANARSADLERRLDDIQHVRQHQHVQLANQQKPALAIEPEKNMRTSSFPPNVSPGMPVPLVESPLSLFGAPVGVELGNISLKALPSLRNSFHLIDEMRDVFLAQIESSDPTFIKKQVIKIEDLKYKILEAANVIDRYKAVEIFDYGYSLHRSFFEYSHSVSKTAISLSSSSSKSLPNFASSITSSNCYSLLPSSRIDYSALPSDLITSQTQFKDAIGLIPSLANDKAAAIIQEMCNAYIVE